MTEHDLRTLPTTIVEAYEQLTIEPTALAALEASRALHRAIAEWQSVLVREALGHGASWDQIGGALGSTRQAAWARFRHLTDEPGASEAKDERAELRRRLDRERRDGRARMREIDTRWREERSRLRDRLRDSQREYRAAAGRHASEKAAARVALRQSLDDLRSTIAGRGRTPTEQPGTTNQPTTPT